MLPVTRGLYPQQLASPGRRAQSARFALTHRESLCDWKTSVYMARVNRAPLLMGCRSLVSVLLSFMSTFHPSPPSPGIAAVGFIHHRAAAASSFLLLVLLLSPGLQPPLPCSAFPGTHILTPTASPHLFGPPHTCSDLPPRTTCSLTRISIGPANDSNSPLDGILFSRQSRVDPKRRSLFD